MKKYLFLYAIAASAALWCMVGALNRAKADRARLEANQRALHEQLDTQQQQLLVHEASVEVLRLRCREFEQLRAADAATIRRQGMRISELMSSSKQVTSSAIELSLPLADSLRPIRRDTLLIIDSLRTFHWRDAWVQIEGLISRDSVRCRIESVDTLHQLVRRIPHRFLFIRWGTKAIRQEIRSSNPHTRLIYSDYLMIEP